MKTVQQNIDALEVARRNVREHCMCARLVEEPGIVRVMFPPGYAVDGAQMRYQEQGVGRARAFELLLVTMEKYWKIG
jgi:hypothetical protein